jgi:hypothetical protein
MPEFHTDVDDVYPPSAQFAAKANGTEETY